MKFLRKSEEAGFPPAIVLSANHLMCKCELLTILSNIALGTGHDGFESAFPELTIRKLNSLGGQHL